jgi:hypothetical protein
MLMHIYNGGLVTDIREWKKITTFGRIPCLRTLYLVRPVQFEKSDRHLPLILLSNE